MFIFGFLVSVLGVVGLFCQYHSQVIVWIQNNRSQIFATSRYFSVLLSSASVKRQN